MNKTFFNFVGLLAAIAIVCTLAVFLVVAPAGGSVPTPTPAFSVASYDTNGDEIISKGEALKAVKDYFDGIITKGQVLEVVVAYFNATPIPTATMTLFLEIEQPTDSAQVSTGSILVSGKTIPGAVVSALVNDIISIAEVNQNGDFTVTLILEEGPNLIEVLASDSQGNQKSSTIAVIYIP